MSFYPMAPFTTTPLPPSYLALLWSRVADVLPWLLALAFVIALLQGS